MVKLLQSDDDNLIRWLINSLFDPRIFRLADGMTRSMGVTTLAGLISSGTNILMLFLVSTLIAGVINGEQILSLAPRNPRDDTPLFDPGICRSTQGHISPADF